MRDDRERGPSARYMKVDDGTITCVHTVMHGSALMLELVRRDGPRTALSYAFLNRAIWTPRDAVLLSFASHLVRIDGRNLLPMFAAICTHRAFRIVEWVADDAGGDVPSTRPPQQGLAACIVERIRIVEPSGGSST
jgi:hypothetical protein